MKIRMLPVLSLALGFALACSGGTDTTAPVVTTPPPPPAPIAADGKIGVPECDEYITKMEACIASADPATKAAMESGFKSTRDAWAQAASIPQTKATLAGSCSSMLASIPTNCGSGATGATGTPGATGAPGTPAATGTAAPAPGSSTTTTTTTTTNPDGTTKKVESTTTTAPSTRTGAGDKAPARETRAPADMSRDRDGSGTRKNDGKSGSGGSSGGSSGGMGRSR